MSPIDSWITVLCVIALSIGIAMTIYEWDNRHGR